MATTANCARGVLVFALLSVAAPSVAAGAERSGKGARDVQRRAVRRIDCGRRDRKAQADSVPSATLIAARARLERFRQNGRCRRSRRCARGSRVAEPARARAAGNHRVADRHRHGAVSRESAGPGGGDVRDCSAEPRESACRQPSSTSWWNGGRALWLVSPNPRRARA